MINILGAVENGFVQGMIFCPIVLSLAFSYRLLKFPDITIEGTFALGSSAFSITLATSSSYCLSVLFAIFCTAAAGVITALLHHYLRINKFLSGIIVITALYSVIIRLIGGSNISLLSFSPNFAHIEFIYVAGTLFLSFTAHSFYRTKYGLKIRGASINPNLSDSLGYQTGVLLIAGLAFNNILAGISGIYFSLDAGFSDLKIGQGTLIIALAALAIGERVIPRSKLSVLAYVIISAIAGSISYQILWAFALQLNIQPSDLKILSATIVVLLFVINRRKETGDEL